MYLSITPAWKRRAEPSKILAALAWMVTFRMEEREGGREGRRREGAREGR